MQAALALGLLVTLARPGTAAEAVTSPRSPFETTPEARARVDRGECVSFVAEERVLGRPRMVLLAYQRVRTSRDRIARAMIDPAAYLSVLPRTLDARVARRQGDTSWIGLVQGNSFIELRYVMRVEPDQTRSLYRFWVDATYPHDLDDAWGFLRLEPLAGSRGLHEDAVGDYLVSYGLVFDLGGGILQTMFSQRILAVLRTIPERLRRYVEAQPAR